MLLSKQIDEVADELREEARDRTYVRRLVPGLVDDEHFWRVLAEMFVIVLHRKGFLVVPEQQVTRKEPPA